MPGAGYMCGCEEREAEVNTEQLRAWDISRLTRHFPHAGIAATIEAQLGSTTVALLLVRRSGESLRKTFGTLQEAQAYAEGVAALEER